MSILQWQVELPDMVCFSFLQTLVSSVACLPSSRRRIQRNLAVLIHGQWKGLVFKPTDDACAQESV